MNISGLNYPVVDACTHAYVKNYYFSIDDAFIFHNSASMYMKLIIHKDFISVNADMP